MGFFNKNKNDKPKMNNIPPPSMGLNVQNSQDINLQNNQQGMVPPPPSLGMPNNMSTPNPMDNFNGQQFPPMGNPNQGLPPLPNDNNMAGLPPLQNQQENMAAPQSAPVDPNLELNPFAKKFDVPHFDNVNSLNINDLKMPEPPTSENIENKQQYDFSIPKIEDIPETVEEKESYSVDENILDNKFKLNTKVKEEVDQETREVIQNNEKYLKQHKWKNPKGPIYLEMNSYKEILTDLHRLKIDTKNSEDHLFRADDYNKDSEKEFEKWKNSLEDIQRKLVFVEKTLFN